MAKRRNFTPEFKAEVVLEALRGESSQAELCRRYNLSENQVSTIAVKKGGCDLNLECLFTKSVNESVRL